MTSTQKGITIEEAEVAINSSNVNYHISTNCVLENCVTWLTREMFKTCLEEVSKNTYPELARLTVDSRSPLTAYIKDFVKYTTYHLNTACRSETLCLQLSSSYLFLAAEKIHHEPTTRQQINKEGFEW